MKARGNIFLTKNMGTADRLARIILAVIVVILLLNDSVADTFALILGVFEAAFIGTSAIGWCPHYRLMNINTNMTRRKLGS